MRTLLVGGTDLTVAVASEMHREGFPPCGVVGSGTTFTISYSKEAVHSARYGDIGLWCRDHGVPYIETTRNEDIAAFASSCDAELGLVAGWYHLLPRSLRDRFPRGVLGIHASLLPKLRGGAPLSWAILSGLDHTGVTLFELGDGVDDGPIYLQIRVDVTPRMTVGELIVEAEVASVRMVKETLPKIASGAIEAKPQVGTPTYGLQRKPDDGKINWRSDASLIDRLIRSAGRPYAGAFTDLEGRVIQIWSARPTTTPTVFGAPGQITRLPDYRQPCVVTGDGLLLIEEATFDDGVDALPQLRVSNNQRLGN